jgi:nitrate reductase gamma subunit
MVWIAFMVFLGGSLYRITAMWRLARKKDAVIFNYISARYSLRSIFHWLFPFGSRNMRHHPVMTVAAFLFHICLFAVPVFLSAHIILINESWNVSWPWLPDHAADGMTWLVIMGCLFFAGRRIRLKQVRYLTTASDYLILAAVALPFVSGTWAFHQWPAFPAATLVHVASAEILLMMIPFTRLSHMLFFPFTRGYMGSEFGAVRKARDW